MAITSAHSGDGSSYLASLPRHLRLDTFYSAPELEHETLESLLTTIERFATNVMPKIQPSIQDQGTPELRPQ
jgi:hypothetical protein